MPTTRKRITRKYSNDFNLQEWQLRYLKTGELPLEGEANNNFEVLEFCWSSGAGLTWLKISDHVQPGSFPYAEENFEQWKRWREVREALSQQKKTKPQSEERG